jgi:hypothetical protein
MLCSAIYSSEGSSGMSSSVLCSTLNLGKPSMVNSPSMGASSRIFHRPAPGSVTWTRVDAADIRNHQFLLFRRTQPNINGWS